MSSRNDPAQTSDEAERAFYEALRGADLARLMSLWSDEPGTLCIHPGGPRLFGRPAIDASWRQILSAGGMQVSPSSVRVVARTESIAVHSVIEQLTGEIDGMPGRFECTATNVYVRDASGWRIRIHHASPVAAVLQADPAAGSVLH